MAQLSSPRGRHRPRLEIIPFIDIMFFLLATFMMVSLHMIHNEGIELTLPKASTAGPNEIQDEQLTISVDESGGIFLQSEAVDLEQLKAEFTRLKAEHPDTKIVLQGDYACDYGKVVEVFDHARRAGLTKLILRTKKPETSS